MTYRIIIREVSRCVIDVEAQTYEEARKKAETKYRENPTDYIFEPERTFFCEFVKEDTQ